MFRQKVVFVVGAGASKEYNFPLGSDLKEKIAVAIRFRFQTGSSHLLSGSPELLDHIRRYVRNDTTRSNEYTLAANTLAGAIPSFISIDEALHYVSESPQAVEVGKIAIVDQILKAERESTLAFDQKTGRLAELPGGWIAELFSMALANTQRKDLRSIFDQVTFINFNYDRAIEQYIYFALQERASATADEAGEIVAGLHMLRPYGSIGQFAPNYGDPFSFGTTAHFDLFSRLGNLGTYTEKKPKHDLAGTDKALMEARLIVFLGFGFHPSNVDLIKTEGTSGGNRLVLGTFAGIHSSNRPVIDYRLCKNLKVEHSKVELHDAFATALLRDHRPRILIMLE